MICDYRDNGCLEKIMLEHFERHIKNCGYEMKTCRFSKCGAKILRMKIEEHEMEDCEHRETACEGECGLMIPLSDRPTHNCVAALKAHIDGNISIILHAVVWQQSVCRTVLQCTLMSTGL